jgi:hypothetical protein
MKRLRFAVAPAVALFAFLSCLSTPSPKTDAGKSPDAALQSSPQDQNVIENPETGPVDPLPSDAIPAAEAPVETAQRDSVANDESLDAKPSLDVAEPPMLPPSERLLYFYPDPDPLLPAQPETVPAKPEVAAKPKVPATEPLLTAPQKAAMPEKPGPKVPATGSEKAAAKESAAEKAKAEVLPGIWDAEPSAPSIPPEKASVVSSVPRQPPSRQITIPAGQTLEVWYPGSGWVFLGDASAQNGLGYENRKLDRTDTLFTFKALKPGAYILDFSRFDVLEDSFLQDSLAVTVSEQGTVKTGRVRAPDYRASGKKAEPPATQGVPSVSPPQAGIASRSSVVDEPGLSVSAVSPADASATGTLAIPQDPAEILKKAETALAAGDSQAALDLLDGFFAASVTSLDEGWFLRGRSYESNGPNRDVRKALEAYQTLVEAFPDSPRWKEADERIRYIRQFYQKIR